MNASMNCDRFAETLADFLERDVTEHTRAALETHALSCDACGPLLADLRRLRLDAANLPELSPTRDLWSGISARIETPIVELGTARLGETPVRHRRPNRALWIGLAAAGLVAVTATITHEVTKRSLAPISSVAAVKPVADSGASRLPAVTQNAPATTVATATKSQQSESGVRAPESVAASVPASATARLVSATNTKPSADQTYDHEIAKLRAVLNYRRHDLDSSTVSVVDKNLKIIDDAIAQCRLALKKDPASRFLLESLNDALDSKVQLLRTAATLPSRT
jgi:hypothetical protein